MTQQPPPPAEPAVPISKENLEDCLESSRYWVRMLPVYADTMQSRADRYSIMSGIFAAISGLTVWASLEKDTRVWIQFVVAAFSVVSAIFAVIPRVKNHGELAGQARQLTSQYGRLEGQLLDACEGKDGITDAGRQAVVKAFDGVKGSKDTNLRDLPVKPEYRPEWNRNPDGYRDYPTDIYWIAMLEQRRTKRKYRAHSPWATQERADPKGVSRVER